MLPFFEAQGIAVSRVLTDRGTEYCGAHDRHEYELYLAVEDIDHTRTKVKSPQTNGICERFNKTLLDEFYRVAFRKRLYPTLDALQADLDAFVEQYNVDRPHQGRWCYGKTPMQTFSDSLVSEGKQMLRASTPLHPQPARESAGITTSYHSELSHTDISSSSLENPPGVSSAHAPLFLHCRSVSVSLGLISRLVANSLLPLNSINTLPREANALTCPEWSAVSAGAALPEIRPSCRPQADSGVRRLLMTKAHRNDDWSHSASSLR